MCVLQFGAVTALSARHNTADTAGDAEVVFSAATRRKTPSFISTVRSTPPRLSSINSVSIKSALTANRGETST